MSYTARICKTCGTEKPLSTGFYSSKREPGGYASNCKECVKAKSRAHQAAKPKLPRFSFKKESDMTLEALGVLLEYDRASGRFFNKKRPCAVAGDPAGYVSESGYIIIAIGGRDFRAHRLVWFIEHGEFPAAGMVVDHINRNPSDNRIENLRVVTQKINANNIAKPKRQNSSGYLGVRLYKGRFTARINDHHGFGKQIGTFDTPEQAHAAYVAKKAELYPQAVIA